MVDFSRWSEALLQDQLMETLEILLRRSFVLFVSFFFFVSFFLLVMFKHVNFRDRNDHQFVYQLINIVALGSMISFFDSQLKN